MPGHTLSANQLGSSQTVGGVTFSIAAAGTANVISADGQTIGLPNGEVSQVNVLATSVNGNQFLARLSRSISLTARRQTFQSESERLDFATRFRQ